MKGQIVQVREVLNMVDGPMSTTVIYERDGKQYLGRPFNGDPTTYYFGGAAVLPNLSDIDAAWAQAFGRKSS